MSPKPKSSKRPKKRTAKSPVKRPAALTQRTSLLVLDPNRASRKQFAAIADKLKLQVDYAADAFEAHALLDGKQVIFAAHPYASDLYPRLRVSDIGWVASLKSNTRIDESMLEEIGCDGYIKMPYREEAVNSALYAARRTKVLRHRAGQAETVIADLSGSMYEQHLIHIDFFKTLLPLEIRRAKRHAYPIAICIVIIDPLPNAAHLSTDVTTASESFVRAAVRDIDLPVRYGEGRFLVFLPHTSGRGAHVVAERVVESIRSQQYRWLGTSLPITASAGVAAVKPPKSPSFSRLIRDAHTAVRAAQLKGGNCAILKE